MTMPEYRPDPELKPGETRLAREDPVVGFYDRTWGEILLWTGLLGAPVLWALQLQTNYTLVRWACATGNSGVLHAVSAAFLLLALASGGLSWWNWKRIGAAWPASRDEGVPARTRLMAVTGLLASALFSLLILAQSLPNFFFNPCEV